MLLHRYTLHLVTCVRGATIRTAWCCGRLAETHLFTLFLTPSFHLGSSGSACPCWDRPRRPLRNPGFPPFHICVRHVCVTFVRAAICAACVFASAGMHVVCIPAVVRGWREMSVTPPKSRKKKTNILVVGSCQCV